MAEGMRISSLDGRLVLLETKFTEFTEETMKGQNDIVTKMGGMSQQIEEIGVGLSKVDGKFEELKQLLLGIQGSNKEISPAVPPEGDKDATNRGGSGINSIDEAGAYEFGMEDKKEMCSEGKELVLVQVACFGREQLKSCFYVVDLEAKKACKTPVATLLNEAGAGGIVRLGSFIYNVGGETLPELNPYQDSDHHIHSGTSFLELSKPHLLSLLNQGDVLPDYHDDPSKSMRWKGAPSMHYKRNHLDCSSLGGKIYALGGLGSAPTSYIGEEFTPQCGEWNPLVSPPNDIPLERFWVSSPVIPDEKNQRLLVHFKTACALYAYYPTNGKWELLSASFWHWFRATALVDGVLYSHVEGVPHCLVAYDLMTKSRLKVAYSAYFPVEVCISEFSNMLHLGSDMLCLANYGYTPNFDIKLRQTELQFIKFRVERTTPTEVHVTPGAINCFPYENHLEAINFIAL